MDKQYIERGALINKIFPIGMIDDGRYAISAKAVKTAIDKSPTADVVPRAAYEQMKWERDVAMQQLNDAGIPFCGETGGKRDVFFVRYLGKPVGECMCREKRVIQNGRDESKEEEQ